MNSVYAHMTSLDQTAGNLGDRMGFLLADSILGAGKYRRQGIRQKTDVTDSTVGIVGSLIAALCDSPATVVGGGLINGNRRAYSPEFKPVGVRGFLTQAAIERDSGLRSTVIGDPGLLLPRLVPMPLRRKKPLGFIVHHVDREAWREKFPDHQDCLIDNYAPEGEFVEQLAGYETVASTSLHGCVFSHAYGVPVAPFVLTDQVFGGDFKFRDYYSAYGIDVSRPDLPTDVSAILRNIQRVAQPTAQAVADRQSEQLRYIMNALANSLRVDRARR
ncbi:hypothetical protein CKW39_09565 [Kocuria sp. WRN011]|uniref:polysaccharide pyruvyl transferase family protein n=1 Tax=Kocuria sp. WRN011 TaxID=2029858 RepID=UPI000BAFCEB2|nr:polysaccharide pyruvyl transferase family protein [Kocuria sp. WRN011]PBB08066.1 hypothetical protein CKW39_09565 [Kocuria sp. WRN011]